MKDEDDFKSQWKRRFENFASKNEDDAGVAGWSSTGLGSRLRYFELYFNLASKLKGHWLDLGCGAGTYTRLLSQRGYSVIGADYSMPSLLKARDRSSKQISWVVADATCLPFHRGSFTGIICFGVTQALPDSQKIVAEVCQALGDNGEVWIDGLNRWSILYLIISMKNKMLRKPDKLRYESPGVMKRLLREQGIKRVKLYWMPIAPGRYPNIQRFMEKRLFLRLVNGILPFGAIVSHSFMLVGYKGMEES